MASHLIEDLSGTGDRTAAARPVLTVVVPVYDGAATIVQNLKIIHSRVAGAIEGEIELIVVSDGSIDTTADVLHTSRGEVRARVIHYDRNLGKGYAVRAGSLAARGQWVAFIDADLDLDPSALPEFLQIAQREQLHFAIGSKRHPESVVHYPASRRVASWLYQRLNRVLFRLDVSDTQVGLKLYSREIVDKVMPLLLVKQFAFDLELLAVARALGYRRVRELPIALDYRFAGSGVRSMAVVKALIDTAAIFYRLRILRTYQRKRELLRPGLADSDPFTPLVSLVGSDVATAERLDYPCIEVIETPDPALATKEALGDLVARLAPGTRPPGNWLAVAVPYFTRPEVSAVVVPAMTPLRGSHRHRAAGAILESRLGAASRSIRFSPGNVQFLRDHPAPTLVARRHDLEAATDAGVDAQSLVAWLTHRGGRVVYVPEAMMVVTPEPLFGPHIRAVMHHARSRGNVLRATHGRSLSWERLATLLPLALAGVGAVLVLASGATRPAGIALELAYAAVLLLGGLLTSFRFRSLRVGLLAIPGLAATHVAYVAAFVSGMLRRR